MDVIISAAQGRGKTTLALAVIKLQLGAKELRDAMPDLMQVVTIGTVSQMCERMRLEKPRAILFDGCLKCPADMLVAVEAVKRYREQTGRPDTLGVYIEAQPVTAIVLTETAGTDRSLAMLNDLYERVSAVGKGSEAFVELTKYCDANNVLPDTENLTLAERVPYHYFLLTLLNPE